MRRLRLLVTFIIFLCVALKPAVVHAASMSVHTVTFDADGGKPEPPSQEVEHNHNASMPPQPEKEGHTFRGWFLDDTQYMFTEPVTADIELIAKYSKMKYGVTFSTQGGTTISSQIVEYGDCVREPEAKPTRKGYIFTGWYTTKSAETKFNFEEPIKGVTTVYAGWKPEVYTVKFVTGCDIEIEDQKVEFGSRATRPRVSLAKEGYTFVDWVTTEGGSSVFNFGSVIEGNTTIYAKWSRNEYTVEFDLQNDKASTKVKVKYGDKVSRPKVAPDKEGYVFDDWYEKLYLDIPYDFNAPVSKDLTLYAKYDEAEYTVTFEIGSGSAVPEQKVKYGKCIQGATTTRAGYIFKGWFKDEDCQMPFSITTPIKEDITLYAKWQVATYTVRFEFNNGGLSKTESIEYGKTVSEPNAPSREGYRFEGWYTNSAYSEMYEFSNPVKQNLILYAKWKGEENTVTFESNGGMYIPQQKVNSGDKLEKPANPVRIDNSEYNVFAGWFKDSSLVRSYNFDLPVTSSFTLYAKWGKTLAPGESLPTGSSTTTNSQNSSSLSSSSSTTTNGTTNSTVSSTVQSTTQSTQSNLNSDIVSENGYILEIPDVDTSQIQSEIGIVQESSVAESLESTTTAPEVIVTYEHVDTEESKSEQDTIINEEREESVEESSEEVEEVSEPETADIMSTEVQTETEEVEMEFVSETEPEPESVYEEDAADESQELLPEPEQDHVRYFNILFLVAFIVLVLLLVFVFIVVQLLNRVRVYNNEDMSGEYENEKYVMVYKTKLSKVRNRQSKEKHYALKIPEHVILEAETDDFKATLKKHFCKKHDGEILVVILYCNNKYLINSQEVSIDAGSTEVFFSRPSSNVNIVDMEDE